MNREQAKELAQSRDCSCVKGKDRDTNFNLIIDTIFDNIEEEDNGYLQHPEYYSGYESGIEDARKSIIEFLNNNNL